MTLPAPAYYRQWSGNMPNHRLSGRLPVMHRPGSLHEIFHPWPVLKESLFRDQVIRELGNPLTSSALITVSVISWLKLPGVGGQG